MHVVHVTFFSSLKINQGRSVCYFEEDFLPQDRISSDILRNLSLFVSKGLDQSNNFSQIMNLSYLTMSDHKVLIFLQMTMYQKIRF